MQVINELRNRQKAIADDFKFRAQQAEKIIGEIDVCERIVAELNESLSSVLGIGIKCTTNKKLFKKVKPGTFTAV